MVVPRGLRMLIRKSARGRFVPSKTHGGGYRLLDSSSGKATGARLRGVAKLISKKLWSDGTIPRPESDGGDKRGKSWRGQGGSLRRGTAVDCQVSRLCKLSERERGRSRMLKLTRMVFTALEHHGFVPFEAQRFVCDAQQKLGTAIDVLAMRRNRLVVLELKCGFHGSKTVPAKRSGNVCWLGAPLARANDCTLHRHFAQLAATWHLFVQESDTIETLNKKGIAGVDACLLYVDDSGSTLFELPAWWTKRSAAICEKIAGR